jgi:hypothetical protein
MSGVLDTTIRRRVRALGDEPLPHPDGTFSGSYGWRDLRRLAAACPPD